MGNDSEKFRVEISNDSIPTKEDKPLKVSKEERTVQWYRRAEMDRQETYKKILGRSIDTENDPSDNTTSGSAFVTHKQVEWNWTKKDIEIWLKKSKEFANLQKSPPETAPESPHREEILPPESIVRLDNRCMIDGRGSYVPLGFTMMWAMWGYRHMRENFEENLSFLKSLGVFDYARIITNVTDRKDTSMDYWDGKGIDPNWHDYPEIFTGTIDTLWKYGFRTEVTIIGSAEGYGDLKTQAARLNHTMRICNLINQRKSYIQLIEVANEAYNIGLEYPSDIAELVRVTKKLCPDLPIAASSPQGGDRDGENIQELFKEDCPANVTTVHFARKPWEDNYRHCRQPWEVQYWKDVPTFFSSNEPRNIHETDFSTELVAMDLANTLVSGGGTMVMHCNQGVRGDQNFWDAPKIKKICEALGNVKKILPRNIANGTRYNHHWKDHPFDGLEDQVWTDGHNKGMVRCYASKINNIYWVVPMGIKERIEFVPKFNMEISVYDPTESSKPINVYTAHQDSVQTLRSQLEIPWETIYKTNVIKYRPPQNNFWRHKEVGVKLQDAKDFLLEEISSIDPACCVLFGNNATKVILNKSPIRSWRGSILWGLGRKVIPTIHPAHILHQKGGEAFKYWLKYIIQFDIARALKQSKFKEFEPPKRLLEVCRSSAQLASFRERFKDADYLALDIEGHGKSGGGTGLPSCVSLSYDPRYAISVPLYHLYPGSNAKTGVSEYDLPEIWYLLAKFLGEDKVRKIGQNFKYDEEKLNNIGFPIGELYADTMLLQHTLYPEFWQSLAFMTSIWTEEPYYKDDGKSFDPSKSKLDQLYTYNARDAAITLEVFLSQIKELEEIGLTDWFFNFIMKLHKLYLDIESVGFRVDEDQRLKLMDKYLKWMNQVHYDIYKAVGYEVNVASPKQVKKLIYDEMNLPMRKGRAKSSDGGTGEDVLSGLLSNVVKDEAQKEILSNILLERRIRKTLGPQYLLAVPDYDGRMRTSVFITGTETNRTSNQLQQPPVRPEKMGMSFQTLTKHGDVGQDVRTFLCPSEGFVLVNVDSMQAEARVVALLANDEDTLRMMDEIDVHALTASWSFGGTWQSHSKKANGGKETPERFIGKTGRHAGHLGIKKGELSKMVVTQARKYNIKISGFSEWKAGKFLEVFHKQCPNVRGVFHYGVEECLSKRERVLIGTVPHGVDSKIGARRQFFERWGNQLFKEAYAYIPQQTVTDNTKAAMLRTRARIPEIRIIGESHDSFCFEAPLGEWEDMAKIAYEEMARPISFKTCSLPRRDLVIPSEVEVGDNYKDMEPVDVMVE